MCLCGIVNLIPLFLGGDENVERASARLARDTDDGLIWTVILFLSVLLTHFPRTIFCVSFYVLSLALRRSRCYLCRYAQSIHGALTQTDNVYLTEMYCVLKLRQSTPMKEREKQQHKKKRPRCVNVSVSAELFQHLYWFITVANKARTHANHITFIGLASFVELIHAHIVHI